MRKEAPPMVRFLDKFIARNMFEDSGSDFISLEPEERFRLLLDLSENFGISLSVEDMVNLALIQERKNFQLYIKEAFEIATGKVKPSNVFQDFFHPSPDPHLPTRRS